jgi:hypothetical protein
VLDDMQVLRVAVAGYRAAAIGAGATWPDDASPGGGQTPDLNRLFDVDHVAGQVVWLASGGLAPAAPLPEGGALVPWTTDPGEWLDYLSFAIATPFPWRNQLPLFAFDHLVFTFVLAGDREGEIWRYEIDPDVWGAVRAATSLAELFNTWSEGIAAGVVVHRELDGWLHVRDDVPDPFALLLEAAPELDPFAFPVFIAITHEPLLRARQRESGVDLDCVARGAECQEQLLDAIAAARASLGR